MCMTNLLKGEREQKVLDSLSEVNKSYKILLYHCGELLSAGKNTKYVWKPGINKAVTIGPPLKTEDDEEYPWGFHLFLDEIDDSVEEINGCKKFEYFMTHDDVCLIPMEIEFKKEDILVVGENSQSDELVVAEVNVSQENYDKAIELAKERIAIQQKIPSISC